MDHRFTEIDAALASVSRTLAPEAQYYWERHRPRYRYFVSLLAKLSKTRGFARILDVGMGYQSLALRCQFPDSRVDCLGLAEDGRYRPAPPYAFHPVDLNDEQTLSRGEPLSAEGYDLIACMEVIEHLYTPPEAVLAYFGRQLAPGGVLIVTTPNAAWLKNRLKLATGRNPYDLLSLDRNGVGHIREYTKAELQAALLTARFQPLLTERRGLYRFNNLKDQIYSWVADHAHPSLRRTLIAVAQKPPK